MSEPYTPNAIRVAIVEDRPEIRDGLALILNASAGFSCVATFPAAEDALPALSAFPPEVVLMDIQLPGLSGIECVRELKRLIPSTQIMMLTVFEDDEKIFTSLAAGATGYLLKTTPPAKLLDAISDLHRGGAPMSNQIARRVVETFKKSASPAIQAACLSPRESQILCLLAKALSYKEIAIALGISIETVRTHIRNIYEKLHVRSRTEAVLKAFS